MQEKFKVLTQKEAFGKELKAISSDITEKDRKKFMSKYGKSATMVSNYINGKVANVDTAAEMLRFFKAQILQRNRLITQK